MQIETGILLPQNRPWRDLLVLRGQVLPDSGRNHQRESGEIHVVFDDGQCWDVGCGNGCVNAVASSESVKLT